MSFNKFLAKLASGLHKPDALTVILPSQAAGVLEQLPVTAFHGVGPATARRLHELGVHTGADLKQQTLADLKEIFGKAGEHFYHIVRGVDERPVVADRPYKSVSTETTFETDRHRLDDLVGELSPLAGGVAGRLERAGLVARTVVVKLKYADFRLVTRRRTLPYPVRTGAELCREAETLLRALELGPGVRLLGVGAEGLTDASSPQLGQPPLFSGWTQDGRAGTDGSGLTDG